jgi:hypothetical protein
VNRRARRAAGIHDRLATLARCPDCDSTVEIERLTDRISNATVRHDDSCPWFRAFQANGGLGVRFVREEPQQ